MSEGNLRNSSPESSVPEIHQFGYPKIDTTDIMASSSSNSPYMSLLGSGLRPERYGDLGDHYHRYQESQTGKSSLHDSKLVMLLEFFRELVLRKREVIKKLFPGLHDELVEVFKKMDAAKMSEEEYGEDNVRKLHDELVEMFKKIGTTKLSVQKHGGGETRTFQRSLSVGSPRTPSSKGHDSPLRLERFKVRTIIPGGGGGGGGGQGDKGFDDYPKSK